MIRFFLGFVFLEFHYQFLVVLFGLVTHILQDYFTGIDRRPSEVILKDKGKIGCCLTM